MKTPTKEQLADPIWWDENAPDGAEFYGREAKDWCQCWYKKDPVWSAYFNECWHAFGHDTDMLDAFFRDRFDSLVSRPPKAHTLSHVYVVLPCSDYEGYEDPFGAYATLDEARRAVREYIDATTIWSDWIHVVLVPIGVSIVEQDTDFPVVASWKRETRMVEV